MQWRKEEKKEHKKVVKVKAGAGRAGLSWAGVCTRLIIIRLAQHRSHLVSLSTAKSIVDPWDMVSGETKRVDL